MEPPDILVPAPATPRRVRPWPLTFGGLLSAGSCSSGPILRWERWAVAAVFLGSMAVQVNAVLHHGSMGQDYPYLYRFSERIAVHPERPWVFPGQDPPVFILVNVFVVWLTGGHGAQEFCGLANLLVNAAALFIFYGLARRFVGDASLRVAVLTLVAFLPLRLIQTVVIAADALTVWPFFALAWVLAAATDEGVGTARRRGLLLAAGLLLTLGVEIKYTFMSSGVAVALVVVQTVRRRQVPWREAALLLALALTPPVGAVWAQQHRHPDFTNALDLRWHGYTAMSTRDILGLHAADRHVLEAPPYNQPPLAGEGTTGDSAAPAYELLADHRYSFLALNHLAIFTDPINIFQYDPTDAYFGRRSERNQRLMEVAVKTAVPITLWCVAGTALLGGLVLWTGVASPGRSRADTEAMFLLAVGWFGNIVVFLPFIPSAYRAGFWTPRLTMVALLGFLLLTAHLADRLLRGRAKRVFGRVALVYVVGQSALQVAFLWPWGPMD